MGNEMKKYNNKKFLIFIFKFIFIFGIILLIYWGFKIGRSEKTKKPEIKTFDFSISSLSNPIIKLQTEGRTSLSKNVICYKINLEGHDVYLIDHNSGGVTPFTAIHISEECKKCKKGIKNEDKK